MYPLFLFNTRLEDDSGWTSVDAYSIFGYGRGHFWRLLLTTLAQRFGVRFMLSLAFGLRPLFTVIVLSESPCRYGLAVGIGFLSFRRPSDHAVCRRKYNCRRLRCELCCSDIKSWRCPDHFTTHRRMDRGHDRFLYNGFSAFCDNQLTALRQSCIYRAQQAFEGRAGFKTIVSSKQTVLGEQ